jgi:hypothetical protein
MKQNPSIRLNEILAPNSTGDPALPRPIGLTDTHDTMIATLYSMTPHVILLTVKFFQNLQLIPQHQTDEIRLNISQ